MQTAAEEKNKAYACVVQCSAVSATYPLTNSLLKERIDSLTVTCSDPVLCAAEDACCGLHILQRTPLRVLHRWVDMLHTYFSV